MLKKYLSISGPLQRLAGSAILLVLLLGTLQSDKLKRAEATFLYVIDGDTFKVMYEQKKESVRLIGIDTPESRKNKRAKLQAKQMHLSTDGVVKLGQESKKYASDIMQGQKKIFLEFDAQPRDKYRRLLAYVYLPDGRMVNMEIVRNGYASLLTIPPNVKYHDRFLKAYREAREKQRGLWQDK